MTLQDQALGTKFYFWPNIEMLVPLRKKHCLLVIILEKLKPLMISCLRPRGRCVTAARKNVPVGRKVELITTPGGRSSALTGWGEKHLYAVHTDLMSL